MMSEPTTTTEDVFAETPDEELMRHARSAVVHLRKAIDNLTSRTEKHYIFPRIWAKDALVNAVEALRQIEEAQERWKEPTL